jgi:hypothetical protein
MFTVHKIKHSCKSTNVFKTQCKFIKRRLKFATIKMFVNIEDTVKFLMFETRSVDSGCERA